LSLTVILDLGEQGQQGGVAGMVQGRLGDRGVGAHHALGGLDEGAPVVRGGVEGQRYHAATCCIALQVRGPQPGPPRRLPRAATALPAAVGLVLADVWNVLCGTDISKEAKRRLILA
jgi:hypothetical protein